MEKGHEREGYIWTALEPAEKKNLDVISSRGCSKSVLRENWRKKKFSRWHERNSSIVKERERKVRGVNDRK